MKLELDFIAQRRPPWTCLLLLLAACAWGGGMALQWHGLWQESGRQQLRLAGLQRQLQQQQREAKLRSELTPAMAAKLKEQTQILAALRYPWNRLLSTLEQADGNGVAVLSFSHEQAAGRTQLQLEAIDVEALTRFVDSLNEGVEHGERWHVAGYQVQRQANPVIVKATVLSK
ncbi:hypothetical protein ACFOLJ_06350 [Rugamonas sp. CCM 8940]|uniref:hypothetical protein n=1 Tax=Rugamonas sp. CCM 8940 TaxID=2765359 RepID=UPI0018F66E38|nr:hypothetical protein [Rugamonas sp. CCM 8940]MBJ7308990.1 hypothetical protein [Rugamonas sp. CCM 8940]